MCGIVGMLALGDSTVDISACLPSMRDVLAHRGPDGAGLWLSPDGRVGLGHRRLSILDLSPSAGQPMSNEDGTLWVTFNGEIYNHASIRRELEQTGRHRWKTDHSDTEVILHAFEEWGIGCLDRFRGMFAFALWDARRRELWLARDRIGIKPLYYSAHSDRFSFASEIKALLRDPRQKREVNEESLFHFLSFLTTPAPETLFAGIKKLPGGTWLRVRPDGKFEERRWWDAWDHAKPLQQLSEREIAARLLEELRESVRLHKVSDVPVGVFLSGGIDSSTNAALFSEDSTERVKTFSIGYDADYGSYPSELPFARLMADRVGAVQHEKLLRVDDLLDFLPEMIRLQDEPIADPVCVPVYYVSRLARENGVPVCQVGEGADELFFGYPWWRRIMQVQSWDDLPVPRLVKQAVRLGLAVAGKSRSASSEWLRRSTRGQPLFWGGAEAFTEIHKHRLLSPRLRQKFRGRSSWEVLRPIRQRFEESAWEKSHLHWMTYLDLNLRLPELLLMRVDKMSMAVSLETRVPFLDHKLVEFALGIPSAMKMKGKKLKPILKTAVRGIIPDEIIDRPKQGFGVPVHEWFLGRLGDRIKQELMHFCDRTDYLDRGEVSRLVDRKKGMQLWYLFNLALWWKEYIA